MAMTRARRHLALIGDSETISKEPFIKGLIDYCHSHGQVLSAHEYLHGEKLGRKGGGGGGSGFLKQAAKGYLQCALSMS